MRLLLLLLLLLLPACRALQGRVECASDADCVDFGFCDTVQGVCVDGGEGEGEGEEGEGEGEEGEGEEGEGEEGEGEGEGEPGDIVTPASVQVELNASCGGASFTVDVAVQSTRATASAFDVIVQGPLVDGASSTVPINPGQTVEVPVSITAPGDGGQVGQLIITVDGVDRTIPILVAVTSAQRVAIDEPLTDVLIVLENAGSMTEKEAQLHPRLNVFADEVFAGNDVRVGLTTANPLAEQGGFSEFCGAVDFAQNPGDLRCGVDTQVWADFSGSGTEQPLDAVVNYFREPIYTQENGAYLRTNALLQILNIGDSPDQGPLPPEETVDELTALVDDGRTAGIRFHVLANAPAGEGCPGTPAPDPRLQLVRETFGGEDGNVCETPSIDQWFADVLGSLRRPLNRFALPNTAAEVVSYCVLDEPTGLCLAGNSGGAVPLDDDTVGLTDAAGVLTGRHVVVSVSDVCVPP